jgi:23S rRNA (uracil1939-C5)-methyltransferase
LKHIKNLKIERIWYGWVGIAKLEDGKKVLIKWWALPWSIVDCNIKKNKKDYIEWHITQIHQYDPKYLDGEIFCPHFFSNLQENLEIKTNFSTIKDRSGYIWKHKIGCWWCKRQLTSYAKQLELKQEMVSDCFRKIEDKPNFLPIMPSPQEKWYRNKIEFSFGVYMAAREWIETKRNLGFHKQWEFSKIVDIDNCWLISDKANKIFEYIKTLCFDSWLPTYDQKFRRGFFRHLVIREWTNTNQILVNLAVFPIKDQSILNPSFSKRGGGDLKDGLDEIWLRQQLKNKLKEDNFIQENITTFVITYNDWLADTVRWQNIQTDTLFWDWYIYEKLILPLSSSSLSADRHDEAKDMGRDKLENVESTFRVSPFSFFQTNTHWAEKLFQTWIENVLNVWEIKWKILDLYCGTGSIGISFLKAWIWDSLLGIEIVEEAIKDANYNAEINWIKDKCKFIASASEKVLNNNPEIQNELQNIWLVIVDPPREWLHKNVIDRIEKLKKENNFKLLYISCNPSTMARDIELFIDKWFKIKSLQAVDMFPQTHHIETVWVLI